MESGGGRGVADGGGTHGQGRPAVESLFKRATNLRSRHVTDDVIKHDISLSPHFTQKARTADRTTHETTSSEENVEEKLRPLKPSGWETRQQECGPSAGSRLTGFSTLTIRC